MFREARLLWRSPGVTLLSVLTMGAGIGASTILFALVNGIVLRPLPYSEADRLVRIFDSNPQAGIERTGVTTGNLVDWRRTATFEGVAGYYEMGRTVTFNSDAEAVTAAQVTQDFFKVFQVSPEVGRTFSDEETQRAAFNSALAPNGADPAVMLSHGIWVERFGGNPNVVGQVIMLDRRPFSVIGVMPAGFEMPTSAARLWIPWSTSSASPRDQHYVGAVARLKAGVSLAQGQAALNAVALELGEAHPATNNGWGVVLSPLSVETVGDTAAMLWILLAAVGLVLIVACANVALLSLIRGLDRATETGLRVALGASTTQLLREFFLESTLLAAAGGVVGAAIAAAGLKLLPSLTADLPRLNEVSFDFGSFAFITAITTLSAILSGLPQAWRRARVSPLAAMSAGTLRTTGGIDRHWLRDGFVVVQVAMALTLLTGSGLLIRSYLQLRATAPGFDPRGVLVAPVFLDSQAYNNGDKTRTYYRTLFDKLSALPGVIAVGGATTVPTSPLGPDFERPVWPAETAPTESQKMAASVRMVTPGYFKTLGLRVAEGRPFDDRDAPDAPRVVMVSETLARRLWPGQRAVGKQLVVDYSTAGTYPYEIVGLVGDLRFRGPRSEPLAEIYLPHAQRPYLILNVVLKTAGDPRALIPQVRAALRSVDPEKPSQGLYPLDDLIGATYARDRQMMMALLVFALASSFLAVLSVYGVLSQRVRERSREIGIRIALGANATRVVGWVASSGLRLIAIGLVVGMVATRALSGALAGMLFGVKPTDVITTIVAMLVLAGIGLIATLVPSWRATRIDPVGVLKRSG